MRLMPACKARESTESYSHAEIENQRQALQEAIHHACQNGYYFCNVEFGRGVRPEILAELKANGYTYSYNPPRLTVEWLAW